MELKHKKTPTKTIHLGQTEQNYLSYYSEKDQLRITFQAEDYESYYYVTMSLAEALNVASEAVAWALKDRDEKGTRARLLDANLNWLAWNTCRDMETLEEVMDCPEVTMLLYTFEEAPRTLAERIFKHRGKKPKDKPKKKERK